MIIINNYFGGQQACLRVCLPVESLTVADVWVPPGKGQQHISEFLDAIS